MKKQRYRYSKVSYVESPSTQHTVGVIIQAVEHDHTGHCLCKFREDRPFTNKIVATRFVNQPPDVNYTYGEILLPAAERLNDTLAVDMRVRVIDEALVAEGRSQEDSVVISVIKTGDPALLNELRNGQPRQDSYDPESPYVYPYFEFSEWENLASKDHITIVLGDLVKEIEKDAQ